MSNIKLKIGDKIKVNGFNCGWQCKHRFNVMGIILGSELEVVSIQPIYGPVTVKLNKSELSISRGLFSKLDSEVIK